LKFFSYGFGGEQSFCALKALLSKEAVFGGASQLAETLDIDCGQDVKYLLFHAVMHHVIIFCISIVILCRVSLAYP